MTSDRETPAQLNTTVAIIGAGLSGLTAARALHRRGIDVQVLEAADRVGGRVCAETSSLGSRLDVGGQWVGHGHHRVAALAADCGATVYPMHTGRLPLIVDGPHRVRACAPSVLTAGAALIALAVLSRLGTPTRWNTSTVDTWIRRIPFHRTRDLLQVLTAISSTADSDRLSVHALASMVRYQGGLGAMLASSGGAQESLIVEGAGHLTDALAAELGERVHTGARVMSITDGETGVTVRTDTLSVVADKVIVAVPPPVASAIAIDPALPTGRLALAHNTYMGSVYKAIAVYPAPFWRERSGAELIMLGRPGAAVFDTTAPDGPGHLCILVAGPAARELDELTTAERRRLLLDPLVDHLGPEVVGPTDWHEKSWHLDEFVGGGYLALPDVGTTDGFLPMPSEPIGNIHWAGTETAGEHAGYLEGAIEAGHRAAREVSKLL
ncbi:FAD-dependent oxidoreductase [Gordonia sp. LSe1-13]|uniref:FAD-dependent oxidoreductase n=1 Tax=Gordonia sesuvii TaxID=3116777 RepID=A0ABU7MG45_9ACTN|nr:FAD-dependent oxidoreductase [Gordonia sp. LSe1-13]